MFISYGYYLLQYYININDHTQLDLSSTLSLFECTVLVYVQSLHLYLVLVWKVDLDISSVVSYCIKGEKSIIMIVTFGVPLLLNIYINGSR
jgi:hypothetical protein